MVGDCGTDDGTGDDAAEDAEANSAAAPARVSRSRRAQGADDDGRDGRKREDGLLNRVSLQGRGRPGPTATR